MECCSQMEDSERSDSGGMDEAPFGSGQALPAIFDHHHPHPHNHHQPSPSVIVSSSSTRSLPELPTPDLPVFYGNPYSTSSDTHTPCSVPQHTHTHTHTPCSVPPHTHTPCSVPQQHLIGSYWPPNGLFSPSLLEFSAHSWATPTWPFSDIQSSVDASPVDHPSLYPGANCIANRLNPITNSNSTVSSFLMPSNGSHFRHSYPTRPSVAPKKGGRRPKEFEDYEHVQLSEEERDKRDKRRQRNKEAAARCRQRRLDLMGQLQEEVDKLKQANEQKEDIIRSLKMQKMELENILRNNGCKVMEDENNLMGNMNHQQSYHAPMHVRRHSPPLPPSSNRKRQPPPVALSQPPKTLKMEPTLNQVATQDLDMQRPTSLTLGDGGTPSSCAGGDCWNPAGLPITTPSSGLAPAHCNSDFMLLNQQTGLTPVTHGALIASYPTSSIATPLDHELKNL